MKYLKILYESVRQVTSLENASVYMTMFNSPHKSRQNSEGFNKKCSNMYKHL